MMSGWALAELLTRAVATSGIVLAITFAVGRFGPAVGGVLAGIPMVLGPGLFFLGLEHDAAFLAAAAAASLVALCGNEILLLAYMALSRGRSPVMPMLIASAIWIVVALVLRPLGLPALAAAALFAALAVLARTLGRRFRTPLAQRPEASRILVVVLRAVAAGLLVAIGSISARWMGPDAAGILLTFPIGFTTLCFSIHRDFGGPTVVETAYSATYGMASLAVFSLLLALCATAIGSFAALTLALLASILATAALTFTARSRRADAVH